MNKPILHLLITLTALLAGSSLRAQSYGYWQLRDSRVFGAYKEDRSDEHGPVTENRNYEKGKVSVERSYTINGQQFNAKASGEMKGLDMRIKPGDEMKVTISLFAAGGTGPRENAIWGRVTVAYGELGWTADNWEKNRIEAFSPYDG